jgi:MFS family permease
VGEGIRGAPRDALLAAAATPATRGRIFGLHRAMDHTGAIAGPVLASLFLLAWPGEYRWLFAATILPGAAAVWMLLKVPPDPREPDRARVGWPRRSSSTDAGGAEAGRVPREPDRTRVGSPRRSSGSAAVGAKAIWRDLPRSYYVLLGVLTIFTLGNSADAFLLLRLSDAGVSPAFIPLLWALLHVVKAVMSVWGGIRSDVVGRRAVIGAGWIIYALVYAGFATSHSPRALVAWFLLYGLYFGLTEGAEKALIADLAPSSLRGTAFGLYNAALGVGALLASVGFGIVWKVAGAPAAFAMGAALSLVATVLLFALIRDPARESC